MRNPFEKEPKTDIGLDMTPRRIVIKNGSGRLSDPHLLDEMLKSGRRPHTYGEQKAPVAKAPTTQRPARIPRTKPKKNEPAASKRISMPKGSPRRCIVKVDIRGYASSADKRDGSKTGNRRLLNHRLDPFKSSGAIRIGSKMAYIAREEAIDGELFSFVDGKIMGWDKAEATTRFGDDPTVSIVISPEDQNADLIELTRRFMEDVYRSNTSEAPSFWVAGIHGNTNHRHVHVVVSCRGMYGGNSKLYTNCIYNGRLHRDTERLLNDMMGLRGWAEEAEIMRRKQNRRKFTATDEEMFQAVRKRRNEAKKRGEPIREGLFVLKDIRSEGGDKANTQKKKNMCSRRLQELKGYGLVYKDDSCGQGEWIFAPEAEEKLRFAEFEEEFGLTQDDMKTMKMDGPFEKAYSGEILETVELDDGKTMLFMIRDKATGIIHLHRERVNEAWKHRIEGAENISFQNIKGGLMKLDSVYSLEKD